MTRHLLIIGAQRSGTSYLRSLLDDHPEITMARPARPEPKVFLSAERTARGLEWYRASYFSHATAETLLGEKSTSYLEYAEASTRAASMLGPAEIVVLLRDPIARAVSNWRFSSENGLEERSLPRALSENLAEPVSWDPSATSVSPFAYLERGRYVDYLPPWLDRFPGHVHVLFFEELVGSGSVMTGLYDALGVDPHVLPGSLGRLTNNSSLPVPELDPGLMGELRHYFRDSDARLVRLLSQELPWAADTCPPVSST